MEIPLPVLLSEFSEVINYQFEQLSRFLPENCEELKPLRVFLENHSATLANDYWQNMDIDSMSIEELREVVNSMPGGFWRAEFRAALKMRESA